MAYVWTWFGFANVLASALLLVLALMFLRARRTEFTVVFGVYCGLTAVQKFSGGMWLYFSADPPTRAAWEVVAALALLALIPALLHALSAFVGGARFRAIPAWAKAGLYAPFAGLAVLLVADREALPTLSLVFGLVFMSLLLLFIVPLWRKYRAPRSEIERVQAKYLLVYCIVGLSFSAEARAIPLLVPGASIPWWQLSLVYAAITTLLLYGILKYHLFSIDLFAKRATYYTTITGALAISFVVLEQVVQGLFDLQGYESLLAAFGAALLIAPVAYAARRPVDRLFPDVRGSREYFERRKVEIYRAQLELALVDGFISRGEHELLERSRRELGLTPGDHDRLEAELRIRGAAPSRG